MSCTPAVSTISTLPPSISYGPGSAACASRWARTAAASWIVHEVPSTTRPRATGCGSGERLRQVLLRERLPTGAIAAGASAAARSHGSSARMAGSRGCFRARFFARVFHGICKTRCTRIPRLHDVVGLMALIVEGIFITSLSSDSHGLGFALRGSPHSCNRLSSLASARVVPQLATISSTRGAAARHADRGFVAARVHAGRRGCRTRSGRRNLRLRLGLSLGLGLSESRAESLDRAAQRDHLA